jgi:hypothetical protein
MVSPALITASDIRAARFVIKKTYAAIGALEHPLASPT